MKKHFPLLLLIVMNISSYAQNNGDIKLPAPKTSGGQPIMDVLKNRATKREFSAKELSLQQLSDLLWAADGINRPESGKRTAPTARNWLDIDLYLITHQGIYLYQPTDFVLKFIKSDDYMKETGKQDFVDDAPLNIIIVSNTRKMENVPQENKALYAGIHAGSVSQNIYLYCTSFGLNTVTRRALDVDALAKIMGLSPDQMIVLAQTVGFPPSK